MSDACDGMDAFREVLDRMVDAERRAAENTGALREARDQAREADDARRRVEADLRQARAFAEAAAPKLEELWKAADDLKEMFDFIHADPDRAEQLARLRGRLIIALSESATHCNQVPF